MYALPTLLTAAGTFDLPLSGRTAEQLVAVLVEHSSGPCAEQLAGLLVEPLGYDAPFALWAVCRSAQHDRDPLLTVDQLAGWLAGSLVEQLDSAATSHAEPPFDETKRSKNPSESRFGGLAGRSFGVAQLASRLAKSKSIDESQAYLLGLLHLAVEWLSATSSPTEHGAKPAARAKSARANAKPSQPAKKELAKALPAWLAAALNAVDQADGGQIHSVADCVAAAKKMTAAKASPPHGHPGFKFNRRQHQSEVAKVGRRWLEKSSSSRWLPHLVARLRALHDLERDFERRLEIEKLDSLKELAYGAGHEINNPLANISARAQTLLQDECDPQRRRLLASINTQAFRAHEMIADMMLFARPPQPQFGTIDLAELVRTVVDELAPQATAQQTELVYDTPTGPVIAQLDGTQIALAIRALCTNALEALAGGGRVELAIHPPRRAETQAANFDRTDETVQITVTDNGPGILPEVRRHLFDPFYSGREAGRGLGFGLSKCWRIVHMHRGRIDVESAPEQGATFTISLPVQAI
jgi:signal transduction histidine kinase